MIKCIITRFWCLCSLPSFASKRTRKSVTCRTVRTLAIVVLLILIGNPVVSSKCILANHLLFVKPISRLYILTLISDPNMTQCTMDSCTKDCRSVAVGDATSMASCTETCICYGCEMPKCQKNCQPNGWGSCEADCLCGRKCWEAVGSKYSKLRRLFIYILIYLLPPSFLQLLVVVIIAKKIVSVLVSSTSNASWESTTKAPHWS